MSVRPKTNLIQTLIQSRLVNLNRLILKPEAKTLISHIAKPEFQYKYFRSTCKQSVTETTPVSVTDCDTAQEAF